MTYQQPNATNQLVGIAILVGPWVFVIGCSIWVYLDAGRIGARKGLISGLGDMGPAGWAWCTLLFWIIGFPLYLAKRDEIRRAANTPQAFYTPPPTAYGWAPPATHGYEPHNPRPVNPPPNWYIDPENPGCNRWWDGHAWTEHRTPRTP